MSAKSSFWSFDTGYWFAALKSLPPVPHDVIGRAWGFAEKNWFCSRSNCCCCFLCYTPGSLIAWGAFDLIDTGVSAVVELYLSSSGFLSPPNFVDLAFKSDGTKSFPRFYSSSYCFYDRARHCVLCSLNLSASILFLQLWQNTVGFDGATAVAAGPPWRRSMWFLSWSLLTKRRPHLLYGHSSPSSFSSFCIEANPLLDLNDDYKPPSFRFCIFN